MNHTKLVEEIREFRGDTPRTHWGYTDLYEQAVGLLDSIYHYKWHPYINLTKAQIIKDAGTQEYEAVVQDRKDLRRHKSLFRKAVRALRKEYESSFDLIYTKEEAKIGKAILALDDENFLKWFKTVMI